MRWTSWDARTGGDYYAALYPSALGAFARWTPDDLDVDVGDLKPAPGGSVNQLGTQGGWLNNPTIQTGAWTGPQPLPAFQFPFTQRVIEAQRFADPSIIPVTVNQADQLLLPSSPTSRRTMLQVQNKDGAASIYYNFGAPASATNGITIEPGQSVTWTAVVPQNDLHLAASADGALASILYAIKGDNE